MKWLAILRILKINSKVGMGKECGFTSICGIPKPVDWRKMELPRREAQAKLYPSFKALAIKPLSVSEDSQTTGLLKSCFRSKRGSVTIEHQLKT